MPSALRIHSATLDANSCSGSVMRAYRIAGIGNMNASRKSGNATIFKIRVPPMKSTAPVSETRNAVRAANDCAAKRAEHHLHSAACS